MYAKLWILVATLLIGMIGYGVVEIIERRKCSSADSAEADSLSAEPAALGKKKEKS